MQRKIKINQLRLVVQAQIEKLKIMGKISRAQEIYWCPQADQHTHEFWFQKEKGREVDWWSPGAEMNGEWMASAFLWRDSSVLDAVGVAVVVSMPGVPGSSSMSEKKVLQSIMMFAQYCEGETKLISLHICMHVCVSMYNTSTKTNLLSSFCLVSLCICHFPYCSYEIPDKRGLRQYTSFWLTIWGIAQHAREDMAVWGYSRPSQGRHGSSRVKPTMPGKARKFGGTAYHAREGLAVRGTAHHARKGMLVGAWGSWLHCIHSWEVAWRPGAHALSPFI